MVNWKAILSLFIIFAIVGLLIFSPKGQKIMGNSTAPVGSFLKSITGRVSQPRGEANSRKLDIIITGVDVPSLGDIEISLNGDEFEGQINYDVISVLGSNFNFDYNQVDVKTGSVIGDISFFRNGKMRITGKTSSLRLGSMEVTNPNMDFLIAGEPIRYELKNIKKNKMIFPYLSGSLRCSQLTGGNLMLSNDQLELVNFEGMMMQESGSVTISGQVDKMVLNGVDISKN